MMKNLRYLFLLISIPCISQWTKVDIPSKASFRALKSNNKEIWASGTHGTVGHSSDAGKTWEFQQIPKAENLDFRDLIIINDREVVLMSAGASEEGKARLFKTIDGGKSWTDLFQMKGAGYFFDCLQWNPKNASGWLLSDPINQKLTLFSFKHDTFTRIDSLTAPKLKLKEAFFAASGSSMVQLSDKIIFVGGGADSINLYTYQYKKHIWKTIPLPIKSGEAQGYFSIGAKNNKEIWAVGGDYRKLDELAIPIITSRDGGNQWQILKGSPKFYMEKVIWANPYWIISGPSQSAAYDEKSKQWRSLGRSSYHNIIQVGDRIWGIGAKGQLGYISLSSINNLFLSKE